MFSRALCIHALCGVLSISSDCDSLSDSNVTRMEEAFWQEQQRGKKHCIANLNFIALLDLDHVAVKKNVKVKKKKNAKTWKLWSATAALWGRPLHKTKTHKIYMWIDQMDQVSFLKIKLLLCSLSILWSNLIKTSEEYELFSEFQHTVSHLWSLARAAVRHGI